MTKVVPITKTPSALTMIKAIALSEGTLRGHPDYPVLWRKCRKRHLRNSII